MGTCSQWNPGNGTLTAPNCPPMCRPEAVGLVDYTARGGVKERALRLQQALLPPMEEVEREARALSWHAI